MGDILEKFAAMIGAATLALLLFAVCHEYGYFSVIGSQFQTFISTSDYFTNATQWIVFALWMGLTWVNWRGIDDPNYYPPLSMGWQGWILPGLFVFLLLLEFFTGSGFNFVPVFFLLLYLWLSFGTKLVPFAGSDDKNLRTIRRSIIAVPILVVVAFFVGQMKGNTALSTVEEPYKIKIKGGEERQRILLRNLDKGLLVRSPTHERIEFIRWDQIEEVTKPSHTTRLESYSCRWLNVWCWHSKVEP
ncbi:hypothetical protein [Bradyrhizobium sp.]|uniref:hypothetical protein n=1 Tax=Bradyrhizobium sp. TaxID=376 RepID=UPI002735D971|nr:hypothetical protein [Bradyrhizobium sp.]MDP3075815.1 hypothetical protein [Bradyrhizobium sp.]